jgi:hypothetical protein
MNETRCAPLSKRGQSKGWAKPTRFLASHRCPMRYPRETSANERYASSGERPGIGGRPKALAGRRNGFAGGPEAFARGPEAFACELKGFADSRDSLA